MRKFLILSAVLASATSLAVADGAYQVKKEASGRIDLSDDVLELVDNSVISLDNVRPASLIKGGQTLWIPISSGVVRYDNDLGSLTGEIDYYGGFTLSDDNDSVTVHNLSIEAFPTDPTDLNVVLCDDNDVFESAEQLVVTGVIEDADGLHPREQLFWADQCNATASVNSGGKIVLDGVELIPSAYWDGSTLLGDVLSMGTLSGNVRLKEYNKGREDDDDDSEGKDASFGERGKSSESCGQPGDSSQDKCKDDDDDEFEVEEADDDDDSNS